MDRNEMLRNPWFRLGLDAWRLGFDVSSVVGLRLLKIAIGGTAGHSETRRMVSEKIAANAELYSKAQAGRLGATPLGTARATLTHYRVKVRANKRRLSKS
jgi:hypothetical protein